MRTDLHWSSISCAQVAVEGLIVLYCCCQMAPQLQMRLMSTVTLILVCCASRLIGYTVKVLWSHSDLPGLELPGLELPESSSSSCVACTIRGT